MQYFHRCSVGEPPDPLIIKDSSSVAFGLFLDFIYRGEQGLDIFNQVQSTGGASIGHIQPGTGYRGNKDWTYSTRYRVRGEQGLDMFNQVKDTGGARTRHIQPGTGYRGNKDWTYSTRYRVQGEQVLDIFNQVQDTGGARTRHIQPGTGYRGNKY
jgi:hypothetical protein